MLKVLFLGHCSFFHVNNLAKLLKEYVGDINITVANPILPFGGEPDSSFVNYFDEIIKLPRKRQTIVTNGEAYKEIFPVLSNPSSALNLMSHLFRLKPEKFVSQLKASAQNKKFFAQLKNIFSEYDVFHFHFISRDSLAAMEYIDNSKYIILHFWGSDLFNTSGIANYVSQFNAIKRSDCVVTSGQEMSQFFLVKFGRNNSGKLRNAYFVIDNTMIDAIIAADKSTLRAKFLKERSIDPEKIVIEVGYNASFWQRHNDILGQISLLPQDQKKKLHLVIPMTYGSGKNPHGYTDSVREAAESSGVSFTIEEEYMESSKMIEHVCSMDIKLNLRDTDNMNTAMIESFCTDTVMVAGSWLPYRSLKKAGVYFREVDKIDELSENLRSLISNIESEKKKCVANGVCVRKLFDDKNVSVNWKQIYDEARESVYSKQSIA